MTQVPMTQWVQTKHSGNSTDLDRGCRRSSPNNGTSQPPDAREMEILAAAQAGSTTAFDQLQRVYSSRLFSTTFRITRNREDAEDALQDTFLRAYMALPSFEGRSSIYSWLTRIAINSSLMILRRGRKRHEDMFLSSFQEEDGHPSLEIKDSASNPEQLCDLRQRRKRLQHAIQTLEPQLRTAIEIQVVEERPVKDVADALNISLAAAKARLFRARALLAERVSGRTGTSRRVSRALTVLG